MTVDDWLKRIKLGEDSTLELKRIVMRSSHKVEGPHAESLADELAAMANANGGTLVLGVDDKTKDIIGIDYTSLDTVEKWLSEICQTRIKPPLDVYSEHIELPDNTGQFRPVIILKVPRSLMVHKSPNGYFKRVLDAKREMEPEVLARLFQQRSQSRIIRFEEQTVPDTSVENLDSFLSRAFIKEGEGSKEQQLRRLHLLGEFDGQLHLSIAGVLLCTANPTRWLPSAYIQAVAYSGSRNDPQDQLDAKDFSGPLDKQIWDAFDFVRLHMKIPARKALGRIDYPQYSLRAIFEAIVNAVVHRDYSIWGGRIRLHLFADRLELYSPGSLPNSMTVETMRMMSMPRNEVLSSLFSRYYAVRDSGLGREYLMDRRGSGVDVILAESERISDKKPVYENLADMELRLTIYAASLPTEELNHD